MAGGGRANYCHRATNRGGALDLLPGREELLLTDPPDELSLDIVSLGPHTAHVVILKSLTAGLRMVKVSCDCINGK